MWVEAFYAGLKGRVSPFAPQKREDRVIVIPLPAGVSARSVRESELVGVMIDYQEIADASMKATVHQLVRRLAEAERNRERR